MAVVCPITSQVKGYPFEVVLPAGLSLSGAVLSDHVKCLDWRARGASFETEATREIIANVVAKLAALVGAE
jgi:mRNA interferase MazF